MGILNLFRGQFIDIIEWADENPELLVHRFERFKHEIKMGAKLIVRPGQKAVFVSEGKVADRFEPGTYTLHTKNLPILTTLLSLPYNFESPFKAEVYFIRTTEQLDRKWGTGTPLMMRDTDFGIVRLRARGNYCYKVGQSDQMLSRFVGSRAEFSCADMESQLKTRIISKLSDVLGELRIPALELAAMYDELSSSVNQHLVADFAELGLELTSFLVENISLPEEVNVALDKRSSVGALGGVMGQYTQMQAADAMRAAAENPGGAGNMMGMLMGAQLAGTAGAAVQQTQVQATPPPLPETVLYYLGEQGKQTGPYTLAQLQQQALNGGFHGGMLVWKKGLPGWLPARQVSELAEILVAVPPPLP
ncbi:MAG: SPFH domain-containing protein [Lentisphaeria bacterium]